MKPDERMTKRDEAIIGMVESGMARKDIRKKFPKISRQRFDQVWRRLENEGKISA